MEYCDIQKRTIEWRMDILMGISALISYNMHKKEKNMFEIYEEKSGTKSKYNYSDH